MRVVLEGEAGVRNDGNVLQARQVRQVEPDAVQAQDLGLAGLLLQLSYNARERFDLALDYHPSYERSFDDSRIAGATHRLDLGLRGALSRRLRLDVRERLVSAPGFDLTAPLITTQSLAVAQRGRQLLHDLNVELRNELTHRTTLVAGLNQSVRRFEESGVFDARTVGGRLGVSFAFATDHTLELTAGLDRFSWENSRQSDVETLLAAYTHPFGRTTHLRLEGGSFYVKETRPALGPGGVAEPGVGSRTGWRGGAQLSQERRFFHWDVGARHDIGAGYGVDRPVTADNAFLGVSTNLGRRLTLGLDGNASRQREIDPQRAAGSLTEFAAGTARASWSFGPALRLTGTYSRIWQRSRVNLFDDLSFDRYFLGLVFRIYHAGESPRSPGELGRGEPTHAESDLR